MITFLVLLLLQTNPWVTQAVDAPNIEHIVFYSTATQSEVSFHIYLPPSYQSDTNKSFPVLYWLHGGGGGLQGIPALRNYFHANMLNDTLPEMIVVFPWGLPFGMWVDSKNGQQPVESMFMENLIPYVDENYRTIADRGGRIIEGFSMGGYGAARLGLTYPDVFAGFSMLGAGPVQLDFINYPHVRTPLELRLQIFDEVYGNDHNYFVAMSPWTIGAAVVNELLEGYPFRSVTGTDDILIHMNRDLRDHWVDSGLEFEYIEVPDADHAAMQLLSYLTQNGKQTFYASVLESATNVDAETGSIPKNFNLGLNYPNPFNPATLIEFTVNETAEIRLEVFDINGRPIAILAEGKHAAGTYIVPFNAEHLASGVYIYRLSNGDLFQSHKMTLIK